MDEKKKAVGVWIKRFIGIVVFAAVLAVFLCWFQHNPEMAKFAAYLIGGGLLLWQVRASSKRATAAEDTATAMQKTVDLTEKGNIAERFKNAIEHLGHTSPSIRLGGIYALHHIALDEDDYRERVFQILCAHIRETTTQKGYKPQERFNPETGVNAIHPSIEIQSILDLLFRKHSDRKIYKKFPTNLEHANLIGATLIYANLQNALLFSIKLEGADLISANLQGAVLDSSNVKGVGFWDANLSGAYFEDAKLQGADLEFAKNLTVEQLLKAKTLYQAKLPDGMEAKIKKHKPELLKKPKPDNEPDA